MATYITLSFASFQVCQYEQGMQLSISYWVPSCDVSRKNHLASFLFYCIDFVSERKANEMCPAASTAESKEQDEAREVRRSRETKKILPEEAGEPSA